MTWQDCAERVRIGDPDRFKSAMTAEGEGRARLFALYAFNLEIAKAPWVTTEPHLAEIRLQWWREALDEIYNGQPPRRHDVVEPLAAAIRAAHLPRAPFDTLIDARAFDIYDAPHAGLADFQTYMAATSGGLAYLAALALGASPEVADTAGLAGKAAGTGGLIAGVQVLYGAGKSPLPVMGALDRNAIAEGRMPDPLARALREIGAMALDDLKASRRRRAGVPLAAVLHVWTAEPILRRAASAPETLWSDPPSMSEFRRNWGFLWRQATGRW